MKKESKANSAESFMAASEHPHKAAINELRAAILNIDARIVEEVKWNAPSFKIDDHFATFRLHPPKNIQIVLHRGAKPKPLEKAMQLEDPNGFVNWKAPDRCVLEIQSSEQALAHKRDIIDLIRQWISQL
ncbi:DUF1801 domain-containing protein [Saccharospirillum mangrovi]|uniref:DUF1801 domain-containing protein n=1 Tax=Saccharospirillum mangrovi TaxID=2161747 RepID=UPI000D38EBA1|nr:DUF1801 domain-containing protein [Saccharospirillum mangrovi]